ncbi:MAG: hypothetical protein GY834_10400 [Bacteroidetes bacterium]|nr:hypothetical protein [Bacteroidota bacterium]
MNIIDYIICHAEATLTNLIIVIIGAFLGFWGANRITKRGEKRIEKKDRLQKDKLDNERLKYVSSIADSICKTAPKQIEEYINLSEKYSKHPLTFHQFRKYASLNIDRLKNFDSEQLFTSYLNFFVDEENCLENYKNIFTHVDFLFLTFKYIEEKNGNHMEFILAERKDAAKYYEKVIFLFADKCTQIEKKLPDSYNTNPEYVFFNGYIKIYKDLSAGFLDFNKLKNQFVEPINSTLFDQLKTTDFTQKCFQFNKRIQNHLLNIEKNAKQLARDINESLIKTDESLKYLTKLSIKIKNINVPNGS